MKTTATEVLDRAKRSLVILFLTAGLVGCVADYAGPDRFGIYMSTTSGENMRALIHDSLREMNHARLSPDKSMITFTRYNVNWPDRESREEQTYDETEIMVMRRDGTGLESLVPPKKGIMAANGYWTPDGKSVIYVSTDNPSRTPQINRIDLASRQVSRVPTPGGLHVSDPHQVGEHLVFPVTDRDRKRNVLWTMGLRGGGAKQITDYSGDGGSDVAIFLGDYDPKLSPNGREVAFMRQMDKDIWHVMVSDLETGWERDLSQGFHGLELVPEWSSDGKRLIFFHVDVKDRSTWGLYTMRPDGTERAKIPLPSGYFYTMPAFFPGEGAGPNAGIIFSARKVPGL